MADGRTEVGGIGKPFSGQRPARSLPERLEAAFKGAGLTIASIAIQQAEAAEGYILTASGFHADNTPFAFASKPFVGDPITRANQAAADIIIAHSGERTTGAAIMNEQTPTDYGQRMQPGGPSNDGEPAGDRPEQVVRPDAIIRVADAATSPQPSPAQPGDLKSLISRLRARKAAFAQSIAETEAKMDEALARGEAHLAGHKAEVDAFIDEINQLTNGGPA